MKRTVVMLAMVAVGCSESPEPSGMPPRGLEGYELSGSVRDEVALVSDFPEPTACHLVAAAMHGWLCNGNPCSGPDVQDSGAVVTPSCDAAGDIFTLHAELDYVCPVTTDVVAITAAWCSSHDALDDDTVACALNAQRSDEFLCCFSGTALLQAERDPCPL